MRLEECDGKEFLDDLVGSMVEIISAALEAVAEVLLVAAACWAADEAAL